MTSRNYDLLKPNSPAPHCPKQHATAAASLTALGSAFRGAGRLVQKFPGTFTMRHLMLADRVRAAQSAACLANFIREATIEEINPFLAYIDNHRGDPDRFPPYKPGDSMELPKLGIVPLEGTLLWVAGNSWMNGYTAGHLKRFIEDRRES